MPMAATTSVTIPSLLDFVGPASSSVPSGDDQPAFGSLLQPPRDDRPAPSPRDKDEAPPASAPRYSNDRPPSADSPPATSNSPRTPTNESPDANADLPQETKPQNASPPDESNPEQTGVLPPQDESQADELILESLAGLNAITQPISAKPPVEIAVACETPPETMVEPIAADDKPQLGTTQPAPTQPAAPKIGPVKTQVALAQPRIPRTQRSADQLPAPRVAPSHAVEKKIEAQDTTVASKQIADEATATEDVKPHQQEQTQLRQDLATREAPSIDPVEYHTQTDRDLPHDRSQLSDAQAAKVDSAATALTQPDTNQAPPPASTAPPTASQTAAASPNVQPQNNAAPPLAAIVALPAPPSRLPAEILAQPSRAAGRRQAIEVDTTRLLTRVARAFTAAQERDGEIRLRLSPPELGSLRLEVRVHDGALTAQLHTETDTARTAILDNLPALRERLADQGVRIERFDVDLMQRQPGGMPDQPGSRQHDFPTTPLRTVPAPRSRAVTTASPTPPLQSTTSADGLNVIV
jgi:flagellar hook-length control protein FliK